MILYSVLFVFISGAVGVCLPSLITEERSYPENHIFLHQIAGACVPSDDSDCFPQEWYMPNKTWKDVKMVYSNSPVDADNIAGWWRSEKVFDGSKKKDQILFYWLKAISEHPYDYLQHILRYWYGFKNSIAGRPSSAYITQERTADRDKYDQLVLFFNPEELYISFSETQDKIFNYLRNQLPLIRTKYCVWGLCVIFIFSLIFLIGKRKRIIFTFFASGSGLLNMLGVIFFSPILSHRYTLSVSILFFISIVAFVSFLIENFEQKVLIKYIFRTFSMSFLVLFWLVLLCPRNLDTLYLARNDKPLWQFWLSSFLGYPMTQKDETNRSVLSWAAAHVTDPKIISFILKKTDNNDINLKDSIWDASPLQFALDHNPNELIAEKLIDSGADTNTCNRNGQSILIQAVSKPYSNKLIKKILQTGADIYATDSKNRANALHWAGDHNNSLEVIKMLIDYGIDVNELDGMNRTAIMKVARRGMNPEIMEYLIKRGALLDIQDRDGRTALIHGCRDSHFPEVLLPLLDSNANVLLKDKNGHDALYYAQFNKYLRDTIFMQYLEKKSYEAIRK